MHIPSPALGGCMLAGIERDTRGCLLDERQRLNFFPATPLAVISWVLEGRLHWVQAPGPHGQPALGPALPPIVLSGPQRRPLSSWSPGAVHALSVGFYPEALARLLGHAITPYFDQHVPLQAVAPPALLRACEAVLQAPAQQAFAVLQTQLAPLWKEPSHHSTAPLLSDWVRSLSTRASHSKTGHSLRQCQRRIREWTGQSQRDLQLFVRVEQAFVRRLHCARTSTPDLAAVAADAGYADQSHMGREIRRVTGLPPGLLGQRLAQDEAFWYYRLMASRVDTAALKGRHASVTP